MFKAMFLSSFIFASVSAPTQQQNSSDFNYSPFSVGSNWEVLNVSEKSVNGCVLIDTFKNKDDGLLIIDRADVPFFEIVISDNNWGINSNSPVNINIDNKNFYSVIPSMIDNDTFAFSVGENILSDFLKNVYTGNTMNFVEGNKKYSLSLRNSAEGINALAKCDSTLNHASTHQFDNNQDVNL